jgi:hypothetical protein
MNERAAGRHRAWAERTKLLEEVPWTTGRNRVPSSGTYVRQFDERVAT